MFHSQKLYNHTKMKSSTPCKVEMSNIKDNAKEQFSVQTTDSYVSDNSEALVLIVVPLNVVRKSRQEEISVTLAEY